MFITLRTACKIAGGGDITLPLKTTGARREKVILPGPASIRPRPLCGDWQSARESA